MLEPLRLSELIYRTNICQCINFRVKLFYVATMSLKRKIELSTSISYSIARIKRLILF